MQATYKIAPAQKVDVNDFGLPSGPVQSKLTIGRDFKLHKARTHKKSPRGWTAHENCLLPWTGPSEPRANRGTFVVKLIEVDAKALADRPRCR
jgi:hypothetical protein